MKPIIRGVARVNRKGIGLIFPNLLTEIALAQAGAGAATQARSETSAAVPGRVISSLLGCVSHGIGLAGDMGASTRKASRSTRCPVRRRRPLKIREGHDDFRGRSYRYPQQVSKVNSL